MITSWTLSYSFSRSNSFRTPDIMLQCCNMHTLYSRMIWPTFITASFGRLWWDYFFHNILWVRRFLNLLDIGTLDDMFREICNNFESGNVHILCISWKGDFQAALWSKHTKYDYVKYDTRYQSLNSEFGTLNRIEICVHFCFLCECFVWVWAAQW